MRLLPALAAAALLPLLGGCVIYSNEGGEKVSVNVSLRRLHDDALIESLKGLSIAPGELCFELIESIFLDDREAIADLNLEQIKALGIDIEIVILSVAHATHEFIHLCIAESQQRKVKGVGLQIGQLHGEHLIVPPGIERQTVVGEDIGALLCVGQSLNDYTIDLVEVFFLSSFQTAMANQQIVLFVNKARRKHPKLAETGAYLCYLLFTVSTSIPSVWHNPSQGNQFITFGNIHRFPFLPVSKASMISSCGLPAKAVVQFCLTTSKISYQSKFACF